MTIVFKVSDNVKEKMIKYYNDKKRDKTPPYAIFQAEEADTIITLYESGKAMFQGTIPSLTPITRVLQLFFSKSLSRLDFT